MRRLLRDTKTKHFLAPDGTWTRESCRAYSFTDVSSLIERAIALDELELEEVLMFAEQPTAYDLSLPIKVNRRAPVPGSV